MGYRTEAVHIPQANQSNIVVIATADAQASVTQDAQYELFRKAICEADKDAWEALIAADRGLVLAWINRHPARIQVSEDDDYWVWRTFERFWVAVRPERWAHFHDLRSVLAYLKLCAHSVLLDEVRRARVRPVSIETVAEDSSGTIQLESSPHQNAVGTELWTAVRSQLPDLSERLVAWFSLVRDLQPREIQARFPERFETVADVYRTKRNMLARLRRSSELRYFREDLP